MNFVAHIQSNQERRQRFHYARILQFPPIQRPRPPILSFAFFFIVTQLLRA
jgi:hypothetical protein